MQAMEASSEPTDRPSKKDHGRFVLNTFDGIKPLTQNDDLSGDLASLEQLYVSLFEPNDDDLTNAHHKKTPSVFAVLDAARVQFLPEMIEASGLEHACLFKGQARHDLGDVAPWLVELDEHNRFSRRLFMAGDEHWHLWSLEPGSYFRSPLSLDGLRKHFRKFTKLVLDDGRVCYFRFWEPRWIVQMLRTMERQQFEAFMAPLSSVIAVNRLGEVGQIKNLEPSW